MEVVARDGTEAHIEGCRPFLCLEGVIIYVGVYIAPPPLMCIETTISVGLDAAPKQSQNPRRILRHT